LKKGATANTNDTQTAQTSQTAKSVENFDCLEGEDTGIEYHSHAEEVEFLKEVQNIVEKDVLRTDRQFNYFSGVKNRNLDKLRRILLNYSTLTHKTYTQGMSDLASPLLMLFDNEALCFWCFVGLMEKHNYISSPKDEDIRKELVLLRRLIKFLVPKFYRHILSMGPGAQDLLFAHRWILLLFKREWSNPEDGLFVWEAIWTQYQTKHFHLFIACAFIELYGQDPVVMKLDLDESLLHFSQVTGHVDAEEVLRRARKLVYNVRTSKEVPCYINEIVTGFNVYTPSESPVGIDPPGWTSPSKSQQSTTTNEQSYSRTSKTSYHSETQQEKETREQNECLYRQAQIQALGQKFTAEVCCIGHLNGKTCTFGQRTKKDKQIESTQKQINEITTTLKNSVIKKSTDFSAGIYSSVSSAGERMSTMGLGAGVTDKVSSGLSGFKNRIGGSVKGLSSKSSFSWFGSKEKNVDDEIPKTDGKEDIKEEKELEKVNTDESSTKNEIVSSSMTDLL